MERRRVEGRRVGRRERGRELDCIGGGSSTDSQHVHILIYLHMPTVHVYVGNRQLHRVSIPWVAV